MKDTPHSVHGDGPTEDIYRADYLRGVEQDHIVDKMNTLIDMARSNSWTILTWYMEAEKRCYYGDNPEEAMQKHGEQRIGAAS